MDRLPHIFRAFFAPLSPLYLVSLIALISLLSACGGDDDDSDTTAPIISIEFPPPASMTEGDTVRVRGTAMDSRSDVSSVEVNGLAVTDTSSDGSFATWEIVVDLVEGENTLTVSATDSEENMDSEAASVMVKRDPNMGNFPNSDIPIDRPEAITVDYARNRLLIGEATTDSLLAIDLETGERSEISTPAMEDTLNPLMTPHGLLIDSSDDGIVWVGDSIADAVFKIDLTNGTRTLISNDLLPNSDFALDSPRDLIEDPNNANYLLIVDGQNGIKRVNKLTGERAIFSDDNTPNTDNPFGNVRGIVFETTTGRERILVGDSQNSIIGVDINSASRTYISTDEIPNSDLPLIQRPQSLALDLATNRDRLLVLDNLRYRITAVALDTGVRSVFSGNTTEAAPDPLPEDFVPDDVNKFIDPEDMYYDGNFGYIFVGDDGHDAILAVDIISGERVFVSVGKEPIP